MDPLRAERVALFGERFRYFCSVTCRQRYEPNTLRTPLPLPRDRRTPTVVRKAAEAALPAPLPGARELGLLEEEDEPALGVPPRARDRATPVARISSPTPTPAPVSPARPREPGAQTAGSLLLVLSTLGGLFCIALALAGESEVAVTARLVLVVVAFGALLAETWMGEREEVELHPLAVLPAPAGAVAVAVLAHLDGARITSAAMTLAALVVAGTAGSMALVRRARRPIDAERARIAAALDGPCKRIVGEELAEARAVDLRPGEELVIEKGQVVPVDASVTAGSAIVQPWLDAPTRLERHEGDVLVGGARVIEGTLRAVVGWAGPDRAWIRLSGDRRRRADLVAPLARRGRLIAERVAPFVSGVVALATLAADTALLDLALLTVAVHAALTSPALAAVPALQIGRAVLEGLRRGVAYRTGDAFDRSGKVSTLAFSARGTLLLGEPEVVNIEGMGEQRAEDVLALVAGAESGAHHAAATAILRAARERSIRPDGVRSPTPQPGLGTTAVASTGQPLVVGTRALMLREHVSVAAAESRITDLEAMGRSVVLVALGGRLVGLLGLQDGLRPGARAAVQHALDVGVEPVLLSSDSRETCEALGRALDIDHVRAEIPPSEHGDEIKRLSDGGAVVAVVGRSPADDMALAAADVSIALGAAGGTASEWNVQLASDDVRDASFAIRLAHEARREALLALLLLLAPPTVTVVLATLGLVSPALAPLAATLGGILALLRMRPRR